MKDKRVSNTPTFDAIEKVFTESREKDLLIKELEEEQIRKIAKIKLA